jgi:hypothetical protein
VYSQSAGHVADRLVEAVAPIQGQQHGLQIGVERELDATVG